MDGAIRSGHTCAFFRWAIVSCLSAWLDLSVRARGWEAAIEHMCAELVGIIIFMKTVLK